MNDMKHQVSMAGGSNLTASQLNKVQGFDPSKFFGRAAGETKAAAPHMDLRYKKLWFRLAYPKGRMKLIAQHITEQMAIFEAQIFLDRSDNEPVGNFIATCTVEDSPNYIEAAQEMALDAALSDAGFGVQFENGAERPAPHRNAVQPATSVTVPPICQTVTGTAKIPGSVAQQQNVQAGNPVNVSQTEPQPALKVVDPAVRETGTQAAAEKLKAAAPAADTDAARNAKPKPEHQESAITQIVSDLTAPPMGEKEPEDVDSLPVAPRKPVADKSDTAAPAEPIQISSYTQAAAETSTPDTQVISMSAASIPAPTTPVTANTLVSTAQEPELPVAPTANGSAAPQVNYTKETPIEEILQLMTFEEAQNVKVDIGTCNGWTMAQVAERRPASLKWYVYGCKEGSNILRAAAQIIMEAQSGKKAG